MRIFIDELQRRHRARLGALIRRHKAAIGYAILTVGVLVALFAASRAIREADHRVERQAAVICTNSTRNDRQQLTNLITRSGHELIASFHLTLDQARVIIHRQLVQSAEDRRALQPSDPRSACSDRLTTLTPSPKGSR